MDFDPRAADDRFGSIKLASRTDHSSFPLKIATNFGSNNSTNAGNSMGVVLPGGASLVRSNSIMPDTNAAGRTQIGCSPATSSTTSADGVGCVLLGNDMNYSSNNMQHANHTSEAAARSFIMSSSCGRSINAEAAAMASYMGINAQRAMCLYNQGHGVNYMMMTAGGGVIHDGDLMAQAATIFTASQLRELQLHALIFKHLMCGVSVPPELSLPIRTSVAASLGWGHFHLGYGGNSFDPEPGRCRRTDGKKWRCSRDVVPDQKYCERHMHRGRHRARKLAPPETGQSAANVATTNANTPASTVNTSSMGSMSNSTMPTNRSGSGQLPPSGHATSGMPLRHPNTSGFINSAGSHQLSQHSGTTTTTAASFGQQQQQHPFGGGSSTSSSASRPDLRYVCSSELSPQEPSTFFSDARGLSLESPSSLSTGIASHAAGAISESSLMMRSVMQSKEQAQPFLGVFDDHSVGRDHHSADHQAGQPLRHFFDDWPRGRTDPASSSAGLAWPTDDDVGDQNLLDDDHSRLNRPGSSTTQLSISIPAGCQAGGGNSTAGGSAADNRFGSASSSNGSSPHGSKQVGGTLSPALKLSMMSSNASGRGGGGGGGGGDQLEAVATHMGLGVGTLLSGSGEDEDNDCVDRMIQSDRRSGGPHNSGAAGNGAMSWVPIAWGRGIDRSDSGNSGAGGPLAEVLHNSSNSSTPRGQGAGGSNNNNVMTGTPLNLMGGSGGEHASWHTDVCNSTSPTSMAVQVQYNKSAGASPGQRSSR